MTYTEAIKNHSGFDREGDKGKGLREILSYGITVLSVVLAVFLFNAYVISSVSVDGHSMEPTLHDGDTLFLNKLKSPEIGDIIVVDVGRDADYIKRVYGLEGDRVGAKNGKVYRKYTDKTTGEEVTEWFEDEFVVYTEFPPGGGAPTGSVGAHQPTPDFPEVAVGKDEVFFLGDNRENSGDSRTLGCRPLSAVVGVVTDFSLKYKTFFSKLF